MGSEDTKHKGLRCLVPRNGSSGPLLSSAFSSWVRAQLARCCTPRCRCACADVAQQDSRSLCSWGGQRDPRYCSSCPVPHTMGTEGLGAESPWSPVLPEGGCTVSTTLLELQFLLPCEEIMSCPATGEGQAGGPFH